MSNNGYIVFRDDSRNKQKTSMWFVQCCTTLRWIIPPLPSMYLLTCTAPSDQQVTWRNASSSDYSPAHREHMKEVKKSHCGRFWHRHRIEDSVWLSESPPLFTPHKHLRCSHWPPGLMTHLGLVPLWPHSGLDGPAWTWPWRGVTFHCYHCFHSQAWVPCVCFLCVGSHLLQRSRWL